MRLDDVAGIPLLVPMLWCHDCGNPFALSNTKQYMLQSGLTGTGLIPGGGGGEGGGGRGLHSSTSQLNLSRSGQGAVVCPICDEL